MKNIIITGCSSGIGMESAIYLKEKGLKVYPTARNKKDIEFLKKIGFEDALYLNVKEYKSIKDVIEYVLNKDGKIDIWFNNAGYGQMGALEDLDTKFLKEQFETNVFGLFEATREVLKVMQKQGYGKIIEHSSILGLVSLPFRGVYNASKYAVEGFCDTLRLELKNSNIYIITLNTGPVESKFRENAIKTLKNIDINSSRFKNHYIKAQNKKIKRVPFSLPAIEVAKVVYKIASSSKPKPRYYITKASYLLSFAKRVLPTTLLDRLLLKI